MVTSGIFGGPRFEVGDFIRFHYTHAGFKRNRTPGDLHDPNKEVWVLNPNWGGKLHGIDLARITPAEKDVLRQIMDPKVKSGETPPRYPLVGDIVRRLDPIEDIKNPASFYQRFVKPFLRNKDAYRQYWLTLMSGIQVVEPSSSGGSLTTNPNPLFKK